MSGRKIQCEVFIDAIARIQIETTTRVMYKGEYVNFFFEKVLKKHSFLF